MTTTPVYTVEELKARYEAAINELDAVRTHTTDNQNHAVFGDGFIFIADNPGTDNFKHMNCCNGSFFLIAFASMKAELKKKFGDSPLIASLLARTLA